MTTLGLGLDYNEDLMTQLARKSDGNHYFIENTADLARRSDTNSTTSFRSSRRK